ncbi:MAG: hypothetical protein QNI84_04745 [Henriciella sp.]|nr:hypothetical protein [Henriciella sp.]
MLHPSTKKLIDRLSEMTARGKLTWQEGEAESVIYSTEGYAVALSAPPHELIITSKDGKELERATAEELAATPLESGGAYTDAIASMRAQAVRIARGTETAISSLLAGIDLDGDSPVEEEAPAAVETAAPPPAEATIEDPADETTAQSIFTAAPTPVEDTSASASPKATPEAEPDMTEAVARLADEVNTREQSSEPRLASGRLTAAATDLAVSVALAERSDNGTLTETIEPQAEAVAEPDTSTEPTSSEVSDETIETVEAEETASFEAPSIAATPTETESVEPAETVEAETPAADATAPVEPADTTPDYFASSSETSAVLQTPAETAVEDPDPAEAEMEASAQATATDAEPVETSEPETQTASTAPAYVPFGVTETTSEPADEPTPELGVEDEPQPAPTTEASTETDQDQAVADERPDLPFAIAATDPVDESPDSNDPITTPLTFGAVDETSSSEPSPQLAETSETEPMETTSTPDTSSAQDDPVADSDVSAPDPAPSRSYSLSGIGAGFGLGAMTSSVGATGGPNTTATSSSEKIIIDATDEVPLSDAVADPQPETTAAIAEVETAPEVSPAPAADPAPPADAPAESAEASEAEDETPKEEVSLTTPRTRFNPWS